MTSFFDTISHEIRNAADQEDDAAFLETVVQAEAQMYRTVTAITGDREFPDDLRHRILGVLASRAVYQPGRLPIPEDARESVLTLRYSDAVEGVHSLFHELAQRRIETRFGLLSDNPAEMLVRREDHDTGVSDDE